MTACTVHGVGPGGTGGTRGSPYSLSSAASADLAFCHPDSSGLGISMKGWG